MTSLQSYSLRHLQAGTAQSLPWLRHAWRKLAWPLGKIVALVALTGVVLGLASLFVQPRPSEASQLAAPTPWTEVNRPFQLYALVGTDLAKLPLAYRARRNIEGGGREDTLTFGDLQGAAPYLRLFLYRPGKEATEPLPFASDLARFGTGSGLSVGRSGAATPLAARFGVFEVADLRLTETRASAPCLGFRLAPSEQAPLRIAGFLCGSAGKPFGRGMLGCVIDKLDLVSAGSDPELRRMFVEAERRRGPSCAPAPMVEAGSRSSTWLDANASLPPLKGIIGQSSPKR